MKPNSFNHPKTETFSTLLGVRMREAWGILDRLMGLTQQYAERGGVGGVFTDEQLAKRLDWTGEGESPELLVNALVGAGFLDLHPVHRYVIHDWADHAPDYTKKKVRSSGKGWAASDTPESSGTFQKVAGRVDGTTTGPSLPSPSLPSPSSPSHKSPPSGLGLGLADFLQSRILQIQPTRKLPRRLDPWARIYDLMMRLDLRAPQEIECQLRWLASPANQTAEARFEVFSANSHRKKFDSIARAMERAATPAQRPGKLARMAAIVAEQEGTSDVQEDSAFRLRPGPRREA